MASSSSSSSSSPSSSSSSPTPLISPVVMNVKDPDLIWFESANKKYYSEEETTDKVCAVLSRYGVPLFNIIKPDKNNDPITSHIPPRLQLNVTWKNFSKMRGASQYLNVVAVVFLSILHLKHLNLIIHMIPKFKSFHTCLKWITRRVNMWYSCIENTYEIKNEADIHAFKIFLLSR